MSEIMKVSFWGVRGSIAAPMTSADIAEQVRDYARNNWRGSFRGSEEDALQAIKDTLWTHGGNTSCVMIEAAGERIILDMGTGIRPLGNSLMGPMFQNRGISATFLISHVHWDHIQGLPFFGPLYMNKHDGILNSFAFHGGTEYRTRLDDCLRGQMDSPNFPVSFREIEAQTHKMDVAHLHDGIDFAVGETKLFGAKDPRRISVTCRKLDHPQEVYGFRIEYDGKVIAFTTDHEPRLPDAPYQNLLRLVKDADLWITDCQYSDHQYRGNPAPQRFGWGHAYPQAIGLTARLAGVKRVVTFHHDPSNDFSAIEQIARDVEVRWGSEGLVVAAYEGMALEV